MKEKILGIVGPTASGKTALAVRLAHRLDGEIVSCDSMQIYRDMRIGTARPTQEEMEGVPHHLFGFQNPAEPFSCADYVTLAAKAVSDIIARGKTPILCGGTGLYLDALIRGGVPQEVGGDPSFRQEMNRLADQFGNDYLHQKLKEIDEESARQIHPNNRKRVIRALEIYHTGGKTKSELDRETQTWESPYRAGIFGIAYRDREKLYRRIDLRVEKMLAEGLAEEAEQLKKQGLFEKSETAAQAIGYKELLPYLEGSVSLSEAEGEIRLATRHYAKRQMTWFGKKEYVRWLYADEMNPEEMVETITAYWENL